MPATKESFFLTVNRETYNGNKSSCLSMLLYGKEGGGLILFFFLERQNEIAKKEEKRAGMLKNGIFYLFTFFSEQIEEPKGSNSYISL